MASSWRHFSRQKFSISNGKPWRTIKNHEKPWKSMKIHEDPWKSTKIHENPWKQPLMRDTHENSWTYIMSTWRWTCTHVKFYVLSRSRRKAKELQRAKTRRYRRLTGHWAVVDPPLRRHELAGKIGRRMRCRGQWSTTTNSWSLSSFWPAFKIEIISPPGYRRVL